MRRIARTRVAMLCTLGLGLAGCTSSDDKEKDAPAVEAPGEIEAEVEIRRDYPDSTFATLTLVQPGKFLDELVEQASPGYDWRAKLDGWKPELRAGFDLDVSIDVLVGYQPKTAEGQRVAFGFGIKDGDSFSKSLAALEIPLTAKEGAIFFERGPIACELPKESKRVHCWEGERSRNEDFIAALDKRKVSSGQPRFETIIDAEYLRGPLKADVEGAAAMARVFGPQALEQIQDQALREDLSTLLNDSVDGALAFIQDVDRIELTIGLMPNQEGVYSRARLRLKSHNSTIATLVSPAYLPMAVAPTAMMHMPADVDSVSFVHHSDKTSANLEDLKKRVSRLLRGAAREAGVHDPTLDTFLDTMFAATGVGYTLQAEIRIPPPQFDKLEDIAEMEANPIVWIQPREGKSQLPIFESLVTYVQLPKVQSAITSASAGMYGGSESIEIAVSEVDSLGEGAKRLSVILPSMFSGLPQDDGAEKHKGQSYHLLIAEDESHTYWGFGGHSKLMEDYLRRAMAKTGPTLADEPRAAFLTQTPAWYSAYTPLDPVYIGEFADEIFGLIAQSDLEDYAKASKQMAEATTRWEKLAPSAMQSRILLDAEGLVWEASVPPTAMRMCGDVMRFGIDIAKPEFEKERELSVP